MSRKLVEEKQGWKTRWALVLAFFFAGGCASGDIEEVAPATCQTNEDCPGDRICNAFTGGCQDPVPDAGNNSNSTNSANSENSENSLNSINPWDTGNGGDPDMGESDMTSPVVCNPACAANEVCDQTGRCVEACMPACEAPSICTENGCEIPDCQAVGDACDTMRPDQGAFVCLSENGAGSCFAKCADAFEASSCPSGEYCIDVGSSTTVNVCLPSDCDTDAQCTQGSCVRFDNDFGICFTAGAILEGQTCSVSNNACEQGTFCRRVTSGSDAGVCASFCDFWASTSDCPTGEACGVIFTSRMGLCTDDTSSTGGAAYESCTPSGSTCGDGLICSGTTSPLCVPFCRPEASDCDGLLSGEAACDNAVLPGDSTFGLCLPSCDPAGMNPCGTGSVCVDNGYGDFICRLTCTPGNEAQDCCGGATSCNFTCNSDNLCE